VATLLYEIITLWLKTATLWASDRWFGDRPDTR